MYFMIQNNEGAEINGYIGIYDKDDTKTLI